MDFYNLGNHALALETSLWTTDIYFKDLWYDYCHLPDLLNQRCVGSLARYLCSASFTTSLSLSLSLHHIMMPAVVLAIGAILLFYSAFGGAWAAYNSPPLWAYVPRSRLLTRIDHHNCRALSLNQQPELWSLHSLCSLRVLVRPARCMCHEQRTTFTSNLIFIVFCLSNVCCQNVGVHANPCHVEGGVRH